MPAILIVDDDTDIAEAIAMVLADEGYEVLATAAADEALCAARRRQPVLALVDYRMPGVDVARLIAALRSACAGALIALSTAADAPDALARASGADLALPKPFQIDELLGLAARAAGAAGVGSHPSA